MTSVAITFPTTHDMLRAEAVLSELISCQNIPAPPGSKSKCTTALLVEKKELFKAKRLMEKEKINWDEITSNPTDYNKFIDPTFYTQAKDKNFLLNLYKRSGMLEKDELEFIFSLKKEQLDYFENLFTENISPPAYSWLIPVGICNEKCDACFLSRKRPVNFSALDWLISKFSEGFNYPVALVYGEKFDENILEYLSGLLNKLKDLPSFLYLGNDPLNLPMNLLSKGSSFHCNDHVLKMKTQDNIIKEILFIKENANQVLASQSLIPIHINFEDLKENEKIILQKTIVCLRLALGEGPVIGSPDMQNDEIKTRGESVRFRWI